MNDFVTLITGIAWPAVVLIVFFTLKKQFAALIDKTRHVKHKDTEVSFNEKLHHIVTKAEEIPRLEEASIQGNKADDLVSALLEVDAYSAILAAWVYFSETARKAINTPSSRSESPARLIDSLVKNNLIDSQDAEILNMIRGLRNDAAHYRSSKVDTETARKVCRVLLVISDELNNKKQEA